MSTGNKVFAVGIDIGSTTAKIVILNEEKKKIFADYKRHCADIRNTVRGMLSDALDVVGDVPCIVSVTGSGGISLAARLDTTFVQEVIAVTGAIRQRIPDADAAVELGGEDAKIIFLKNGVEQRMNGICAGGTGAFIDQMAALLQTDAAGLNEYAKTYTELYPIAARCGVFAKSDIQPLINDGVSKEDLAASIFQAVVNQTISGLACGRKITGKVVFLGGPLYFLSELGNAFVRTLHLSEENAVFPENAHLFAAYGAALHGIKRKQALTSQNTPCRENSLPLPEKTAAHGGSPLSKKAAATAGAVHSGSPSEEATDTAGAAAIHKGSLSKDKKAAYSAPAAAHGSGQPILLSSLLEKLENMDALTSEMPRLPALFEDETDYRAFLDRQAQYRVPRADLNTYTGNSFLGIDAGSTTMKLALVSEAGELLYSYYGSNQGDPVQTAKGALLDLYRNLNPDIHIRYSCSTGYGESLLKSAFHLDEGEVETIAHYEAAHFFDPNTDCILDIGGQDMKCIHIREGCVDSITLNEACSSGCGSFIENFANSLGCSATEFAQKAVRAKHPVDLGTRCTVFMNSNVKQAQKEGANVDDIAAGLAYSVIKNALFKVIKLKDAADLGETFVVQGGTFYNDAVLRCLELVTGREAIRPDIAGLMGAFGAALIAKERWDGQEGSLLSREELEAFSYRTAGTHCRGCQNACRLTVSTFPDGGRHISGNRCEKGLLQNAGKENAAPNLFDYKRKRLFSYEPLPADAAPRGEIGIPRVLNLYEDYPFWAVFFKELGFRILLSPQSDMRLYQRGMDSIPSESECYPAKLAHGHIEWLINQGAETIFYPCVYYERKELESLQNNFNCPMVTSYPENIRNNVDDIKGKNIRFLSPFLAFTDEEILTKELCEFMQKEYSIEKRQTQAAAHAAWEELLRFREDVKKEGQRALDWIKEHNADGIVLAGRPYHLDPEVNHGIPEMIHSYGLAVLTEDSVAALASKHVTLRATNQWVYHSRLYAAAEFVSTQEHLELIQLNSFGCGLDAITTDQVQDLMHQCGKLYTLLKIDEINSLGSARIRVRSMLAAMKLRRKDEKPADQKEVTDYKRVEYTEEMQADNYTLLCTSMIPHHFRLLESAMRCCGYNFVMMQDESQNVIDLGLKYVNNDACYPALIVTGQVMDAVFSGKYDTNRLAVIMVQTGGGCRASNYIGFIRKALADAGYGHIPVISVSTNLIETNSGFHYTFKMGFKCLQALIYGDILMRTLHRVRPYERVKNSANELYEHWMQQCSDDLLNPKVRIHHFYRNCQEIIRDFENLPLTEDQTKPKVGIVGEVLVKYMPIANNHLDEMLESEGAEVVIPDFMEFLEYMFSNSIYRKKYLGGKKIPAVISRLAMGVIEQARRPVLILMKCSSRFHEQANFRKIKKDAQNVLALGNQCGEGWFLPGEIIDLIQRKVDNIVCAQPFGCLPNHIVGKGVIKRLKELYPDLNIVAIDYDPGASKVNQQNRIKLMMEAGEEREETRKAEEAEKKTDRRPGPFKGWFARTVRSLLLA